MSTPALTIKSISLVHIQRVGFSTWNNREWWLRHKVRIWSNEHGAFWRQDAAGYTDDAAQAWEIDFATAYERAKHCGPEKKINFLALKYPASQQHSAQGE